MRLDDLYLVDIIEAREEIDSMMAGASFRAFKTNRTLVAAVEMKLIIIGEALSAMKPETRGRLPAALVQRMRGVRNRVVHGYFQVDDAMVFGMATRHAPKLAAEAEKVLADQFADTYERLQQRRAGEDQETT